MLMQKEREWKLISGYCWPSHTEGVSKEDFWCSKHLNCILITAVISDPTQEAFKVFIMSRRTHCIGTFREFGYLGSLLPNNFYIVRSLMWTFQGHCLWIFLFQSTKISLLVYIRGVRAHRRQAAWGDSEHFLSPWAKNENSCFPQSFDISCLRKLYKSWEEKAKGKKGFSNMWKDTGYFPLMMTWVWYHV